MDSNPILVQELSRNFSIHTQQAQWITEQIAEGATVPFLARYRKESTGGLDEAQLFEFYEQFEVLQTREKRRNYILKDLTQKNVLTKQLELSLLQASSLLQIEDLYEPYKTRKQTLADKAREMGLGPLADKALSHYQSVLDLTTEEREGVKEICAESLSFSPHVKENLRKLAMNEGLLSVSKARGLNKRIQEGSQKEHQGSGKDGSRLQLYEPFFDSTHRVKSLPSHRILALFRGKEEKFLSLSLELPQKPVSQIVCTELEHLLHHTSSQVLTSSSGTFWTEVLDRAYKGFLLGSVENWCFQQLKDRADTDSIRVFAENLRAMIEQLPSVPARIMAIDPGFTSGCKFALLDSDGSYLHHGKFDFFTQGAHVHQSQELSRCQELCNTWSIDKIIVGNGTAGRETQELLESGISIPILLGDERGASVYSASKSARTEFPHLDLTYRGAISIGRRYLNPMNELVKISPESLGVGQYQHDIDQKKLTKALQQVVTIAVNSRGVELNSAGPEILEYVSGLKPKLIDSMLEYRNNQGKFRSRKDLLKVKGLGEKLFEQCAGFLTIEDADNPLDSTPIHPELYSFVQSLEKYTKQKLPHLLGKDLDKVIEPEILKRWKQDVLLASGSYGEPTWVLISQSCKHYKKKRYAQEFSFSSQVHTITDLKTGMVLPGKITNITAFGAFTDLGVHKDGLIHISQMSDTFVRDPLDILSPGIWVQVEVLSVEPEKGKIQLKLISKMAE